MALEAGLPRAELPLPGGATPEELRANPGLARLLRGLSAALGPDGLGRGLGQQLEQGDGGTSGGDGGTSGVTEGRRRQAEAELQAQRGAWLRWESVWRLLQEAACEPPARDDTFPAALARALDLAELRRDLALPPAALAPLLPPAQERAEVRARLLPELERRLRDEVLELRSYHGGGGGGDVGEAVAGERRRLRRAQARGRELAELLERQRGAYPQALGRCGELLGRLAREQRLGAQAPLDRRRADYLEAKGAAMLLKIRLEELTLLLDTYPAEKVEAHRVIRAALEEALGRAEAELGAARAALGAFGALGPGFGALAREYGRLRQLARQRRWALRQLRSPGDGPGDDPGDDLQPPRR
ncbi:HAUS augmin-like complex subunit 4 [Struthio camelus]|uniref:HAUS augmin-like complex subunit 4 n=1 Tax=Struthio camelus TaxID=8801 RepID=UPI003603BD54